jgi:SAM-dependent methyltransferase
MHGRDNFKETVDKEAGRTEALEPMLGARPLLQKGIQLTAGINRHYNRSMFHSDLQRHYGGSDFWNHGFWEPHIKNRREACENLMEKLLSGIPRKEGSILDVACGKGGTTRYLLRYYDPAQVTGNNISTKQLQRCRVNAPGCRFVKMSATALSFPDCSFDNIICVEAAFHFHTRADFLRETHRVLKPGGRLVLSDILRTRDGHEPEVFWPKANFVASVDAYRSLCTDAGFNIIELQNATRESFTQSIIGLLRFFRNQFLNGDIGAARFRNSTDSMLKRLSVTNAYLLATLQK